MKLIPQKYAWPEKREGRNNKIIFMAVFLIHTTAKLLTHYLEFLTYFIYSHHRTEIKQQFLLLCPNSLSNKNGNSLTTPNGHFLQMSCKPANKKSIVN